MGERILCSKQETISLINTAFALCARDNLGIFRIKNKEQLQIPQKQTRRTPDPFSFKMHFMILFQEVSNLPQTIKYNRPRGRCALKRKAFGMVGGDMMDPLYMYTVFTHIFQQKISLPKLGCFSSGKPTLLPRTQAGKCCRKTVASSLQYGWREEQSKREASGTV